MAPARIVMGTPLTAMAHTPVTSAVTMQISTATGGASPATAGCGYILLTNLVLGAMKWQLGTLGVRARCGKWTK